MIWLKRIWRGMLLLKDGMAFVALLIFFGGLSMLLSGPSAPGELRGGALLLDLDGVIVEKPESVDPLALLSGQVPSFSQYRASDVVRALKLAEKDRAIKSVVLNLDGFMGGGQVVLQDVAKALRSVRKAGKPVLTYATGYSDDAYLLAAETNEIWLNPMGGVVFAGPGGTQPYFKGLIDRLAVNVHVYRVGKYKSFVEPYTRDGMSPEAREASEALQGALWEDWKAHVKQARPSAAFEAMATDPVASIGSKGLAQAALDLKLVDKVGDETSFAKRVAGVAGSDPDRGPADFNRSDLAAYLGQHPDRAGGEGVGVVTVAGAIVDGNGDGASSGGDTIERLIHSAIANDEIKALVVRVDSPGGSAVASEKIRLAMLEAKKAKLPVVVSMGNVAASGGYWVSMGGDRIFAEPATITGSIGVFGIVPTFENTLARYGVTSDGTRTTPLSGQPDIFGGTTPETDKLLQAGIDDTYRRFTSMVAAQRKQPVERIEENAQGRVWAGGMARQLGLVDAFGSIDDAIAEAAKRAGLDPANVRRIDVEDAPSFLSWLAGGFGFGAKVSPDFASLMVARNEALLIAGVRDSLSVLSGPAVQVRCIECPASPALLRRGDTKSTFFSRMFQ